MEMCGNTCRAFSHGHHEPATAKQVATSATPMIAVGNNGRVLRLRSALGELSEPVVATDGVHWLAPGEQRVIGINSLTANILCGRHNSALSPLDDEGGQFLRTIKSIHASLGKKSLSRKTLVSIVSGEALEMWILKIACGLFYSKNASQNGQILSDHAINDSIIAEGFFS